MMRRLGEKYHETLSKIRMCVFLSRREYEYSAENEGRCCSATPVLQAWEQMAHHLTQSSLMQDSLCFTGSQRSSSVTEGDAAPQQPVARSDTVRERGERGRRAKKTRRETVCVQSVHRLENKTSASEG